MAITMALYHSFWVPIHLFRDFQFLQSHLYLQYFLPKFKYLKNCSKQALVFYLKILLKYEVSHNVVSLKFHINKVCIFYLFIVIDQNEKRNFIANQWGSQYFKLAKG